MVKAIAMRKFGFMLRITAQPDIEIQLEADRLNGETTSADLKKLGEGSYHLIRNGKTYRLEVLEADFLTKSFQIRVNGQAYDLHASDQYDLLLEQLGMDIHAEEVISNIQAPMPGLVLSVDVAVGDAIEKGQAVLVLEAMKMENVIKSPGAGIIKSLAVKPGDAVEKNQVLLELE